MLQLVPHAARRLGVLTLCAVMAVALGCDDDDSNTGSDSDGGATGLENGGNSGNSGAGDPPPLPDGAKWAMTASGAVAGSFDGNVTGAGGPTDGSAVVLTLAGTGDAPSLILPVPAERGATGTFAAHGEITLEGETYRTEPQSDDGMATVDVTFTEWIEAAFPGQDPQPKGTFTGTFGFVGDEAIDPPLEVSGTFDSSASPF